MVKKKVESDFGFNNHLESFFTNPESFFERIKDESLLTSVKFFGVFLLLTILGNVVFGKPSDVSWVIFGIVLVGSLFVLYLLFPLLLCLSARFFGSKLKFPKILGLYGYNVSYLLVVSMVLRIIFSNLLRLGSNIYLSFFVSAVQFFVIMLFLMMFFHYTVLGLQKVAELENKNALWSFILFVKIIFVLVLIGGFVFFKVIGLGSSLL
ncbi:YIP1 family protein [Candidatus Woesearchaeota archaeon]|nr:YIP1 family protein [Candidatus Woesearchaeota archaeon]